MKTIGRAVNRPASTSGSPGSSHAAATIAGTTVMARNTHPASGREPGWGAGTGSGEFPASLAPVSAEARGPRRTDLL